MLTQFKGSVSGFFFHPTLIAESHCLAPQRQMASSQLNKGGFYVSIKICGSVVWESINWCKVRLLISSLVHPLLKIKDTLGNFLVSESVLI